MLIKQLIITSLCLPLLATKPAMRLDRYLKGKTSLANYLSTESNLIFLHFLTQASIVAGVNNEFLSDGIPSIIAEYEKFFLESTDRVEDALRHLLRKDAPLAQVFAKQYFIQGCDGKMIVTDHDQVSRLARLVEGYGHIFPENDLHKAKVVISEIRELMIRSDLLFHSVDTTTDEEQLGVLVNKLDQLVYEMLVSDTDGADFFAELTKLTEQFVPQETILDNDQISEEDLINFGNVAESLTTIMVGITDNTEQFDPDLGNKIEQSFAVDGIDIDADRFIQFSLLKRKHLQLLIRYFSDELDSKKFIEHYRALVERHRQAYDPECLECVFSALDQALAKK